MQILKMEVEVTWQLCQGAQGKHRTKNKTKHKTTISQISQKETRIILQLQQENKELRDKLDAEQQEHDHQRISELETTKRNIREWEVEVDVLISQIPECDDQDKKEHQQKIKTLQE